VVLLRRTVANGEFLVVEELEFSALIVKERILGCFAIS